MSKYTKPFTVFFSLIALVLFSLLYINAQFLSRYLSVFSGHFSDYNKFAESSGLLTTQYLIAAPILSIMACIYLVLFLIYYSDKKVKLNGKNCTSILLWTTFLLVVSILLMSMFGIFSLFILSIVWLPAVIFIGLLLDSLLIPSYVSSDNLINLFFGGGADFSINLRLSGMIGLILYYLFVVTMFKIRSINKK